MPMYATIMYTNNLVFQLKQLARQDSRQNQAVSTFKV